jgi:hypothetical protein
MANAPSHSINYFAPVALTIDAGSAGDVMIASEDVDDAGRYVKATSANRNGRRSAGIALSAYAARGTVPLQQNGLVDATVSGLDAAVEDSLVRVSAAGRLERVTDPDPDEDVVGLAHTDGSVHLWFGAFPASWIGAGSVADDVAKSTGAEIDRVRGQNGVSFVQADGSAVVDGTAPPVGGAWTYNSARGHAGFKAKRPTPAGWFDAADYGAIGDGSSHPLSGYFASLGAAQAVYPHATALSNEMDWAAIQAAINAAMAAETKVSGPDSKGGRVHVGRGVYLCDQPLDCKSSTGLRISGNGQGVIGTGSAVNGGTTIRYTGSAKRFLDIRSSFGFTIEHIALSYNNTSFNEAGRCRLIDATHYTASDTTSATFRNCCFGGAINIDVSLGQGCYALLHLGNAISCLVDNCNFTVARRGIYFRDPDGSYSNSHRVKNCLFTYLAKCILNANENVSISDCTVEGLGGITTAFYMDERPETRATGGAALTFSGSKITRGSGSFVTDGWIVGKFVAIAYGPNASIHGLTTPLVKVSATELDFTADTITTTSNTITRSYGSFITDGFTVGMAPVLALTGCPFNGTQGAITNVTASTLTITGAVYGGAAAYTSGTVYHLANQGEFDAYTPASAGHTFSADTSTVAYLYQYPFQSQGLSIRGCWMGDQFLSTAWIKCVKTTGLSLHGNFIAGNSNALDVQFEAYGISIKGNHFQTGDEPLVFCSEGHASLCLVDGAAILGNYSVSSPLVLIPDDMPITNFAQFGNPGDALEARDGKVGIGMDPSSLSPALQVNGDVEMTGDALYIRSADDTRWRILVKDDGTLAARHAGYSGWVRGSFSASPWEGVASGAESDDRDFSEATNPPGVGATVDGFAPADFDGTNDVLASIAPVYTEDFLPDTGGYGFAIAFNADVASAAAANAYNDPGLISDAYGFNIGFSNGGVGFSHYDGAWNQFRVACTATAWHVAIGRFVPGSGIQLRKDNGAWSGFTAANNRVVTNNFYPLLLGKSGLGAAFFNGKIMEVRLANYTPTDDEADDWYDEIKARYPTMGLP